jgi:transposase
MTAWGGKISAVDVEELRATLRGTENDGKAVKRLMAAIAYKQGFSPSDIEATFGFPEKSVYQWLDRFEDRGIEGALYDEPKPGRPSRLTDDQLVEIRNVLEKPPEKAGFDADVWSPMLLQQWIAVQFDVKYSIRHVRRLIDNIDH